MLEICGRRRESGSATYLLFIDFAAAYDSFFLAVQSPAGEGTGTMTAYTEQPP
jgi:hypothetical protein